MSADEAKAAAARAALAEVKPGMRLGIGTGSTAAHFVRLLGAEVRAGLDVAGAPTSEATRRLMETHGVPLLDIDAVDDLDLAVDGADEADSRLTLIKGGGGALLREKIVAAAARRFVVIADASKHVARLGAFPLPVEVTPFAVGQTTRKVARALRETGCAADAVSLRMAGPAGKPFVTDGANYILDCAARVIPDAAALAAALKRIPGVVEDGLFIGMAQRLILGRADGGADIIDVA
ncbi:MAG: ribose-5-phosphate isomerase RpiA [Alphaproteobacteria bacterium]|nr:ribose-5-phosphate isomerase RpiA [Alphaproteobacteria bacterium]